MYWKSIAPVRGPTIIILADYYWPANPVDFIWVIPALPFSGEHQGHNHYLMTRMTDLSLSGITSYIRPVF